MDRLSVIEELPPDVREAYFERASRASEKLGIPIEAVVSTTLDLCDPKEGRNRIAEANGIAYDKVRSLMTRNEGFHDFMPELRRRMAGQKLGMACAADAVAAVKIEDGGLEKLSMMELAKFSRLQGDGAINMLKDVNQNDCKPAFSVGDVQNLQIIVQKVESLPSIRDALKE